METNKEAFQKYFKQVVADMARANSKVPVSSFRAEANEYEAQLFAPDWFQYMIFGRGPGKQPPPDKLKGWVERNPDLLESARTRFKYITAQGLAFIIGRKIAREGTDVWQGKRKGVPFLEAMETNMGQLLKEIAKNEAIKIQTSLHKAIKQVGT